MEKKEQVKDSGRYQLIPRTLVFIFNQDKVLLLKGGDEKPLWPGKYNAIGGHVERGEDIERAARREIREETGLSVQDIRLSGTVTIDIHPNYGICLFVFTATSTTQKVCASAEGTLEWFPLRAIPSKNLVDDLPVLLEKVISTSQDAPPFSGHYSYDQAGNLSIYL